jgi:galactose mutarotase-like enzyme
MSIYVIANKNLRATVNKKGAELTSLENLHTNLEYIWQGDPKFWERQTPHLFPIVGRLKDNQFYYNEEVYEMAQHGFARDLDFDCIKEEKTSLSFLLKSSEETKVNYPFDFELQIDFDLKEDNLHISYKVINSGGERMYFSIGGHPGFTCPLLSTEKFTDYFFQFEHTENLDRHLLSGGLFNHETEKVINDTHILHLDYELFKKDAIVVKNYKSSYLYLKSLKGSHGIKFFFPDFPYLGLWTKGEGAKFICIEPWFGLADYADTNKKIEEKIGILSLDSGKEFNCNYTINVF